MLLIQTNVLSSGWAGRTGWIQAGNMQSGWHHLLLSPVFFQACCKMTVCLCVLAPWAKNIRCIVGRSVITVQGSSCKIAIFSLLMAGFNKNRMSRLNCAIFTGFNQIELDGKRKWFYNVNESKEIFHFSKDSFFLHRYISDFHNIKWTRKQHLLCIWIILAHYMQKCICVYAYVLGTTTLILFFRY